MSLLPHTEGDSRRERIAGSRAFADAAVISGRSLSGTAGSRLWLLAAGLVFGHPAGADFKATATFASDYVYRGYSKSRGNPVMQGNADYEFESGLYGGIWVSQASYDDHGHSRDPAEVEVAPYVGWGGRVEEDWRAELSAIGYLYTGQWYGQNVDYSEFTAALHYRDLISAKFAAAPDAYHWDADTYAYELLGRYSLLDNLQVSAGFGFHQARELVGFNYFYGNAGVTWFIDRHIALDARYVDSNYSQHEENGSVQYFSPRGLGRHYVLSFTVGF